MSISRDEQAWRNQWKRLPFLSSEFLHGKVEVDLDGKVGLKSLANDHLDETLKGTIGSLLNYFFPF